jgi:hypothetical protein
MAYPSITYTIPDGTNLDATWANTNFSDLTSGLRDGSKDLQVFSAMVHSMSLGDSTVTGNISANKLLINTSTNLAPLSLDSSAVITGAISSISTSGWNDWFPYASVQGWRTLDSTKLMFRKSGFNYTIAFDLDGTVNNDTTGGESLVKFYLPAQATSGCSIEVPCWGLDDNTQISNDSNIIKASIGSSSQYCGVYTDWYSQTSWASGRDSYSHLPYAIFYFTDATSDVVPGYYKMSSTQVTGSGADGTWTAPANTLDGTTLGCWITDTPPNFTYLYNDLGYSGILPIASVKADATPAYWKDSSNIPHNTGYRATLFYRYYYLRDGTEYHMWDSTCDEAGTQYHGIYQNEIHSYSDSPSDYPYFYTPKGQWTFQANDRYVIKVIAAKYSASYADNTVSMYSMDGSSFMSGSWGDPYNVRKKVVGTITYLGTR